MQSSAPDLSLVVVVVLVVPTPCPPAPLPLPPLSGGHLLAKAKRQLLLRTAPHPSSQHRRNFFRPSHSLPALDLSRSDRPSFPWGWGSPRVRGSRIHFPWHMRGPDQSPGFVQSWYYITIWGWLSLTTQRNPAHIRIQHKHGRRPSSIACMSRRVQACKRSRPALETA